MTAPQQPHAGTRIGPSGRAAFQLLACCPRIPTDVVGVLLRLQHARSAAQLLLRLRTAGLAQYETVRPGPVVGSRVIRLWTLTTAGRAILGKRGLVPSEEAIGLLPYSRPARWHNAARQRDVPMLVVVYRLLACVVHASDRPVRVGAWERPWIRVTLSQSGRARHVRLPAAAVLIQDDGYSEQPQSVLLLPDVGTIPVASFRPVLRGLIELRQSSGADPSEEPLLIVGVAAVAGAGARVAAWHSLLQQVARRAGDQPLRTRVVACPTGLLSSGDNDHRFSGQPEQVFGLIARHPLLTLRQLAMLLGTSEARATRIVVQLRALGWVRAIRSNVAPLDVLDHSSGQQRTPALLELTPPGRKEAARRLLLPPSVAARHHGLLGKDASSRQFLRNVAHTLGANAVFVAFVSAARNMTMRGGSDALEEWRSAAACARGRFRPDGYGCYRRQRSRFGFFLEFDRGTEKAGDYAAKLAAYYRYRDSAAAHREYVGFPTLLVVTTRSAAEARFAYQAHLAQQRYCTAPLSMFLTTTGHIQASRGGVLGPIWRSAAAPWAAEPARGFWLPARGAKTP